MSEKMLVHPQTASLIKRKDAALDHLREKRYYYALAEMHCIVYDVDRCDVDAEFKEAVIREYRKMNQLGMVGQNQRSKTMKNKYWEWFEAIDQILYDKGYITMEKFGVFHDPSGGKKS